MEKWWKKAPSKQSITNNGRFFFGMRARVCVLGRRRVEWDWFQVSMLNKCMTAALKQQIKSIHQNRYRSTECGNQCWRAKESERDRETESVTKSLFPLQHFIVANAAYMHVNQSTSWSNVRIFYVSSYWIEVHVHLTSESKNIPHLKIGCTHWVGRKFCRCTVQHHFPMA